MTKSSDADRPPEPEDHNDEPYDAFTLVLVILFALAVIFFLTFDLWSTHHPWER